MATVLNFKDIESPELLLGLNKKKCCAICAICNEPFVMESDISFYNKDAQPVCWGCAEITDGKFYGWVLDQGVVVENIS